MRIDNIDADLHELLMGEYKTHPQSTTKYAIASNAAAVAHYGQYAKLNEVA